MVIYPEFDFRNNFRSLTLIKCVQYGASDIFFQCISSIQWVDLNTNGDNHIDLH